jgi:PilZ domain
MYEQDSKRIAQNTYSSSSTTANDTERRSTDRQMFTASADVIELVSGARFSTRTTDLGPGGCFVDTTVPFPVGSKLRITLHKGKMNFETAGTVVYSQTGLGMGIAFDDLDKSQRAALEEWLAGLIGENPGPSGAPHSPKGSPSHQSEERAALIRLVRLMIGKSILTEAEGTSVLHDPVL